MPTFNSITPAQLMRLIGTPDAPIIIDVCTPEDFAEDRLLVPTARRHDFAQIAELAPELLAKRAVIICQKGKKLSQGAAAILRSHGVAAEVLEGGVFAWRDAGLPRTPAHKIPARGALWVTRHRPKIDRIACPWLIRRFVDPGARFLYVPTSDVTQVAEKFGAIPFDVPGTQFSHMQGRCTFDALLAHFELDLPALTAMAEIIRAADGTPGAHSDQAAGVLAISLGLSRMFRDDLAQLEAAMPVYDALYRWARDAQDEVHDWDAHDAQRGAAT